MGQYVTGYCAVCGKKVLRSSGEVVTAAGRLRCETCQHRRGRPSAGGKGDRAIPPRPRAVTPRDPRMQFLYSATGLGLALVVAALADFWFVSGPKPEGAAQRREETETPKAAPDQPKPDPGPVEFGHGPRPASAAPAPERVTAAVASMRPQVDGIPANDIVALRAAEGRLGAVRGVVDHAAASQSGKVFRITFGGDMNGFMAVIFPDRMPAFESKFGDLVHLLPGRAVLLRGSIQDYKGRPEIVLDDPSQIELQ